MGKPSAPKAPDPYSVANADFAFNNPSQYTPYGNLINTAPTMTGRGTKKDPYRVTSPGTSTLELTPEMQGIFDNQLAFSQLATNEALRRGPELSNLPAMPNYDPQRYTDAFFSQQRGLLDPVFAEQERALQDRLANQGLPTTGEAYGYDVGLFNRERNDAYSRAANDAVLAGQQYGMNDLQAGAFQRQIPFNEIASLLGLQQVQMPQLNNFYQPRGADFMGAQALRQQQLNNNYQSQMGLYGNMMEGLFGLGGAAIGKWG